jgi:hypothetical protein
VKNFHSGGIRSAALGCAALFLLAVSPWPSLAQRGGPGATAAGRRTDTLNRQAEQYERDRLSREGKGPTADPDGGRRAQDVTEQVKRDFEGLQAAYNKLVLAMAPGGRLDFDSILDSVDGAKKCAARLRANLALPKAKDEEGKARGGAGATQMEESLLLLRKHIYSFVTNPLFEATHVLNVEQAGKAGRDLDMIIELSESIRRSGRQKGRQD